MGRYSNALSRGRKTQVIPNVLGLVWITLSGCNTDGCDFSGLKQIAGKEPTGIDFPGEELGSVTDFHPSYALGRNGSLKAIAGYDDSGAMLVVPADGTDPCAVPIPPEGAELAGVLEDMLAVSSSTDDSGLGTLALFDAHCEKIGSDFADARVVPRSERLVPLRMLVMENTDELVAIDAASRKRQLIDTDVSLVYVMSERIIVLSGGKFLVRNMALEESYRFGDDVTEAAIGPDGTAIAYVDGGRVTYRADVEAEPSAVDEDACGLDFADEIPREDDVSPRYLSYYSPCEASRLVVYDLERDVRTVVGEAPSSRAAAREIDRGGEGVTAVFYYAQVADDSGRSNIVSLAVDGADPVTLGAGDLDYVGRALGEGVHVWLDAGGEESRIERVTVSEGPSAQPLLDGVVEFTADTYPERALIAGSDSKTSLVAIEGYASPTVIAEDAPSVGGGTESLSFFGSDADGDLGTLLLLERGESLVEIASPVAISTVRLGFSAESLFYLRDYDTKRGSGELCMNIVRNGDTYCEPDVTDYQVSIRPKRAVTYVKRIGSDFRLFWAPVQ